MMYGQRRRKFIKSVHCFYSVHISLINIKLENMDMQTYLVKIVSLIADYSTLMTFTAVAKRF